MRCAVVRAAALSAALICLAGCRVRPAACGEGRDTASRDAYLARLDSMAQIHVGVGARHIDVDRHLVEYDGRHFLYGCDWGSVLEIPAGWTVEVDGWQALASFHGTAACSPDSLVRVSYYGGLQTMGSPDEDTECLLEWARDEGIAIGSMIMDSLSFGDTVSPVLTVTGRNGDGINMLAVSVFADHHHVTHGVVLQWPDGSDALADSLRLFISRFPFGPLGQLPEGWAAE